MFRFILKRLVILVPMVLIVVSLTWGLIRLAPGNFYTGEKRLPPAIEKNIRAKYGLDQEGQGAGAAEDEGVEAAAEA